MAEIDWNRPLQVSTGEPVTLVSLPDAHEPAKCLLNDMDVYFRADGEPATFATWWRCGRLSNSVFTPGKYGD